jgi:hypothetical protein
LSILSFSAFFRFSVLRFWEMIGDVPHDALVSLASTLTTRRLLTLRLVARPMLSAVSDALARRAIIISPPEYTLRALLAFPAALFSRSLTPESCTLSLCVGDEGRCVDDDLEFVHALTTTHVFSRVGATRLEITNVGPNVTPVSIKRIASIVRTLPRLTEAWLADIRLPSHMLGAIRDATTLRVVDVALEGVDSAHVCSTIAALGELRSLRVRCTLRDARPLDGLRDIALVLRGMPNVSEVDIDVRHAHDWTCSYGTHTTLTWTQIQ